MDSTKLDNCKLVADTLSEDNDFHQLYDYQFYNLELLRWVSATDVRDSGFVPMSGSMEANYRSIEELVESFVSYNLNWDKLFWAGPLPEDKVKEFVNWVKCWIATAVCLDKFVEKFSDEKHTIQGFYATKKAEGDNVDSAGSSTITIHFTSVDKQLIYEAGIEPYTEVNPHSLKDTPLGIVGHLYSASSSRRTGPYAHDSRITLAMLRTTIEDQIKALHQSFIARGGR